MSQEYNVEELLEKLKKSEEEAARYKRICREEAKKNAELSAKVASAVCELESVLKSKSWRITAPLRWFFTLLRKIPGISHASKVFNNIRLYGFKHTVKKIKMVIRRRRGEKRALNHSYDLNAQRAFVFEKPVKFSVIVPLYNTPENYLREMIESVKAQTYSGWELCLADGSDDGHPEVERVGLEYAKEDERIKYKRLDKNFGISANTNAAIQMATGDYIALFDHDDKLHPAALFEMMKAISEKGADFIYTDEAKFSKDETKDAYHFFHKPDFSPDMLRSYNYICHFTAFSRELLDAVGAFRPEFDGSQDYDIILRLTEKAKNIVHIPEILYFWRCHPDSVASNISAKPYTVEAAKKALAEHIERIGLRGEVTDSQVPSTYRIKYEIKGEPLVSILIPTKDHIDDLDFCLRSIYEKTTYKNFEVIVIENNSQEEKTFEYYKTAEQTYPRLRVVYWEHEFNYSKINNFGATYANGEYFILLNNDIEILTPEWIEEMLMFTQRSDVGICGMMLYYPDDTIQHAGVIIGIGDVAGHSHKYYPRGETGYFSRLTIAQNYSAVTAAAMMVRKSVYNEVGGLEESFAVAFNDVDFCMKVRRAGYNIVWTPYAEAYHYESKSRGYENNKAKVKRFHLEVDNFISRWGDELESGDPYYNPNLTLESEDFSLR
ncbi:MAG: glycosyltransferase family 2 protein [Clostridia bacterium]|nr:glycosyltransferase family 2 protein [Clostridia bacterium]